jgi:hypothetical protein
LRLAVKLSRISLLVSAMACAACTSVAPLATPSTSASVTASAPAALATLAPVSSLSVGSVPASVAPPSTEVTELPAPTPTPTPTPKPTPKPTKKPTPTPSPTATPTPVDLAIYVNTSDIPNPWYNDTDYTIPIHVTAAGNSVVSVQVKVSIPEEAFSTSYSTGPIADGGDDAHNVTINVPAIGPATLTLAVRTPDGFKDITPSNNKVTIAINVQLKP